MSTLGYSWIRIKVSSDDTYLIFAMKSPLESIFLSQLYSYID